jgi:hypothetical protein
MARRKRRTTTVTSRRNRRTMTVTSAASRKKPVTSTTVVYTAAAWWTNSEPSMRVVALSPKKAERDIVRQMRDAARSAREDGSYRSIADALDDIGWSGVHAEPLATIATDREMDGAIADLEADGVWYPEY